jgi:hypothetical protein
MGKQYFRKILVKPNAFFIRNVIKCNIKMFKNWKRDLINKFSDHNALTQLTYNYHPSCYKVPIIQLMGV